MVVSMSIDIDEPLCKGMSTSTAFWAVWVAAVGRSTATSAHATQSAARVWDRTADRERGPLRMTDCGDQSLHWAWVESLIWPRVESEGRRVSAGPNGL